MVTAIMMQEVWNSVKEWYQSRGVKVPKEEELLCKREVEREAREAEYFNAVMMKRRVEYELEIYKAECAQEKRDISYEKIAEFIAAQEKYKKVIESVSVEERPAEPVTTFKASHGSPEFWKDYWAKKKAAGYVPKGKASASPSSEAKPKARASASPSSQSKGKEKEKAKAKAKKEDARAP
jgi:hypothetical protein